MYFFHRRRCIWQSFLHWRASYFTCYMRYFCGTAFVSLSGNMREASFEKWSLIANGKLCSMTKIWKASPSVIMDCFSLERIWKVFWSNVHSATRNYFHLCRELFYEFLRSFIIITYITYCEIWTTKLTRAKGSPLRDLLIHVWSFDHSILNLFSPPGNFLLASHFRLIAV